MEGDGTSPWYRSVVFPTQAAAIAFIMQELGEAENGGRKAEVQA